MPFPTSPTAGQRYQDSTGVWYTWKDCGGGVGAWDQDRNQLTFYDPIPIGAIMAFGTSHAPNGWLLCDGSSHPAANFPELASVLLGAGAGAAGATFKLPDLRGEFLRGRADGAPVGDLLKHIDWTTGLPKNALTTSDPGNHSHKYWSGWGSHDGISSGTWHSSEIGWTATHNTTDTNEGAHTHTIGGGDAETAPDHTVVDYYMKASHAKVALPASGFMANASSSLNDGDVWVFDAVANEFTNVNKSTLVSGMTVGTTAPTAPFVGQQYYKTDGSTPGLRVWDGTKWAFSSGGNVNNTGSRIIIPGYFNQDPSDTATPSDNIGLAARYNSDQVQLFANKANTWHRIAPETGVAANEGRLVIADAKGEPTWGPSNPPSTKWLDSVSNSGAGYWAQELDPKPKRYIKWDMSGSSNANTRLMVIMHVDNGWWHWHADLDEAQCITHYESSGLREEYAAIKSDWWKDAVGGRITDNDGYYLIKANTTWFCNGSLLISDDRALFIAVTDYTSDNNTPMKATFRARITHDFRGKINQFGFKFQDGTGWFVGHATTDAG